MKQIVQILIVALALISCSRPGNDANDQTPDNKEPLTEVVGTWMIFSKDERGVVVHCNVCPILTLNADYSGEFIEVSKIARGITFDLIDGQLIFSSKDPLSYFGNEAQFEYHLKDEGGLKLMELESVKRPAKYMLASTRDL